MERLLTVEQVAKHLAVARRTVYRMLAEGTLQSLVVRRGARRIPESEINRYITEQLQTSPKPEAW